MSIYFYDLFAGAAGTPLAGTTSTSGNLWANDTNHLSGTNGILLDGNGRVFCSAPGMCAQIPVATMPTGNFEILYTLQYLPNSTTGIYSGISLYVSTPFSSYTDYWSLFHVVGYGTDWFVDDHTNGWDGTFSPTGTTLYYIKILVLSALGTTTGYFYYSTDNLTWHQQNYDPSLSWATPTEPVAVGLYFSGAGTLTSGPHIGSLYCQDVVLGTPNSTISKAYISSSGASLVFFFETGSTAEYPQIMLTAPTVYVNGTSLGSLSSAVPWINGSALCMLLPLPVYVQPTDTVTVTTTSGWMLLVNGGVVGAITNLPVTNYVGVSAFGTDALVKTLKPGFGIATSGFEVTDGTTVSKNLRYRLDGFYHNPSIYYPGSIGQSPNTQNLISIYGGSSDETVGTPTPLGMFAIGYDDNYIAAGGTATQLALVPSYGSQATVTHITSCDNPGTGGIGQFYMFQVGLTSGATTASADIALQWTNSSLTAHVSNLFIYGPGEFTYTLGTPLYFDRSQPYAIAQSFLNTIPNGCGSLRWLESTTGFGAAGNCIMCEPWELHDLTDYCWSGPVGFDQKIGFLTFQPLTQVNSPYIYADQFGSPWTALSSPLATGINATQTTITLSSAATECNGNPLFYGIMLEIGAPSNTEYMRVTGSSGTTVTVVRGSAFNGVLTPAVAHSVGETVTCCNRYLWSGLGGLGSDISGNGHTIWEIVTSNGAGVITPHNMKTGQATKGIAGSYPSYLCTDGTELNGSGAGPCLVTGPNTYVVSGWNGSNTAPNVTLAASHTLNDATNNWTNFSPTASMPYEFTGMVTSYFNCNHHCAFPALASDSMVYNVAARLLSSITPGRHIYIELSDEPWNYGNIGQQCTMMSSILGSSNIYYWYVIRVNQIVNMMKTAFGSRASEIKLFLNGGPQAATMASLAIANSVNVDYMGVATYITADNSSSSITFSNYANVAQLADAFIHEIYYLSSVTTGFMTAGVNAVNTLNAAGQHCQIYAYEGGYACGCSPGATGPAQNNSWYSYQSSQDVRYMPVWRIYEKDWLALVQSYGYSELHIYAHTLYYYYQNCWNVYTWMDQKPGKGDGSDGQFDNRTCLVTPGYTGPTYFTKAAGVCQDRYAVSVRGQAISEWMAEIGVTVATSFTLTPPSPDSGLQGHATGNFTVTPNRNYTGTITLTPSDGETAKTLTFSSSSVAQSTTFTPTTVGTLTVTPTNSGSLTNPSAVTYTVNASGLATAFTLTPPSPDSGLQGQATGNFTVTPNDPYTGTITLTPSDGETAKTLTFSSSDVAQSTTFTPTTVGTLTVTPTNSGSLTNPSAATYTVNQAATTFTLTPPSPASGLQGQATGNFTVTPNDPYTGTITLTPSDGETAQTLTFSSSSVAQSTTFTPTTVGTLTVTPTNSGSLTNPSAVTYTVNASGLATAFTLTPPSPDSGLQGQATGNFTVTPNGNYTGTITLTPSDGETTQTLTFSSSDVAQSTTFTPITVGTLTVTPTNNGSLTNPSAVTYTVNPVATTFTLTPPSPDSGLQGQATGNFTITPNNPYTGIITLTPSDGETAQTLTFSSSATAQSVTFTPIVVGTLTVTPTNSGSLTNPSAVTYTVNASGLATAFTLTPPSPDSGLVGYVTGNFTVTPNGNYTGTITLTPSDGESEQTLTFASYDTAQSAAFTPTTVGTLTVTPTNNGSLTNPSAVTYTVNPVATTFTLTPPSPDSGLQGQATGNFTVTPNHPYSGTITLTPSDGESAKTLTFSSSSVAQSTKFTPTVAGTLTVTPTNSGSLTNPSAVTYTVNSSQIFAVAHLVSVASMVGDGTSLYQTVVTLIQSSTSSLQSGTFLLTVTITTTVGIPITTLTGQVEFYDGSTLMGISNVVEGIATWIPLNLSIGIHSFYAYYEGNDTFAQSQSFGIGHSVSGTVYYSTSLYVNPSCTSNILISGVSICLDNNP